MQILAGDCTYSLDEAVFHSMVESHDKFWGQKVAVNRKKKQVTVVLQPNAESMKRLSRGF
jgi:hypothetical protein